MSCGVTGVGAGGAANARAGRKAIAPATAAARTIVAFAMRSSQNRRRGERPRCPAANWKQHIKFEKENPSFALAKPGLSDFHGAVRLVADREPALAPAAIGELDGALDAVAIRAGDISRATQIDAKAATMMTPVMSRGSGGGHSGGAEGGGGDDGEGEFAE